MWLLGFQDIDVLSLQQKRGIHLERYAHILHSETLWVISLDLQLYTAACHTTLKKEIHSLVLFSPFTFTASCLNTFIWPTNPTLAVGLPPQAVSCTIIFYIDVISRPFWVIAFAPVMTHVSQRMPYTSALLLRLSWSLRGSMAYVSLVAFGRGNIHTYLKKSECRAKTHSKGILGLKICNVIVLQKD